jgi:hypothetical protein
MTAAPNTSRTLVSTLADTLQEPNVDLLRRVVRVLGETRAQAVLEETLTIEAAGDSSPSIRAAGARRAGCSFRW